MTKYPDLFAALAAPFESHEVRVRTQAGRQIHYITARVAMNRLDTVLGPENWWDNYAPGENSVLCRLTVRIPDPDAAEGGGWVTLTKCDAGGYAGMPDSGDDEKSGYSDSFKRAAVKFGVGRYLYRDGVPTFVREREPGTGQEPRSDHPVEHAPDRPAGAPSQARPPVSEQQRSYGNGRHEHQDGRGGRGGQAPRTGRALFPWVKEMEQRHEVGLLKYLNGWAKLQDFPGRMVDWDEEQVRLAHAEAVRKLRSAGGESGPES